MQILVPDTEGLKSEAECWDIKPLQKEQSYQGSEAPGDVEAAREVSFGSCRQQKAPLQRGFALKKYQKFRK